MKVKVKGKGKGKCKCKGKVKKPVTAKGQAKEGAAADEDPTIDPPFKLTHRWKPIDTSQAYMMGTVGGEPTKIITNISCIMSHDFSNLMQQLLKEANEGAFKTKKQAVLRRDQLIASKTQAAPAADTEQAAPATPSLLDGLDLD